MGRRGLLLLRLELSLRRLRGGLGGRHASSCRRLTLGGRGGGGGPGRRWGIHFGDADELSWAPEGLTRASTLNLFNREP